MAKKENPKELLKPTSTERLKNRENRDKHKKKRAVRREKDKRDWEKGLN